MTNLWQMIKLLRCSELVQILIFQKIMISELRFKKKFDKW